MKNEGEAPNVMVKGAMGDQDPANLEDEHLAKSTGQVQGNVPKTAIT